jgi:hypothetical protein
VCEPLSYTGVDAAASVRHCLSHLGHFSAHTHPFHTHLHPHAKYMSSPLSPPPFTTVSPLQEVEKFLAGANSMDDHFRETPLESNLPVLMGLASVWNISFLGYPARAILPYCQVCCLWASRLFHRQGLSVPAFACSLAPTFSCSAR